MSSQSIAQQRIQNLYRLANETVKTDPDLARRYIHLMRRIAQRTRTKIPQNIRDRVCKKCDTPLIPGYNATIRINQKREPHITTRCQTCGNITRRPIRSRKH
jgi:ribonuclease P protein subunit RPR2